MSCRQRFGRLLLVLLALATAQRAAAADVLDNVPHDAMALVYMRDLASFDAQMLQISRKLQPRNNIVLTPLVMLQAVVGRDTGLDSKGELLLVALSSDRPLDRPPLCAWLPVDDYDQFTRALGGNPVEQVTVITLMGEDLLCAHHDKWAVIMDPDQRPRMNETLAGHAQPPQQIVAWREWLRGNQAAIMALPTPASRGALRGWIANPASRAANQSSAASENGDWIFGSGHEDVAEEGSTMDDLFGPARHSEAADDAPLSVLRRSLQKAFATAPKLVNLAIDADAIALGVRLNEAGDTRFGVRMDWSQDRWTPVGNGTVTAGEPAVSLHREGNFSVSGAGSLPPELFRAAVEAYTQTIIEELRSDSQRSKFDDNSIARFREASAKAAADVTAAAAFHAPVLNLDGVYTNQFLAVRVASADAFAAHFSDVMRTWNDVNQAAQPSTGLVFESQKIEVGGRSATQHSLDIAASEGFPDSPELRRSMERFFGPDRKLHLFIVPIDETTVLLAQATAEQTAATIKALKSGQVAGWATANVAATNQLLPQPSAWRLFVSPSGYSQWLKQETDASFVEVIGAKASEPFPAAPPIGLAGGFPGHGLWIDAVVPAETLNAAGAFLGEQ